MPPPSLTATDLHSLDIALYTEWLETNGLGGYSASTVSGAHSRRYHGLLVAAITPPVERCVMLSRLDETIICGGSSHELSTAVFDGAIYPQGFEHQTLFTRDIFPVWEFSLPGIRIRKTVGMLHGANTVVVRYECLEAPASFTLRLRPFVAARDYHALTRRNNSLDCRALWRESTLTLRSYPGMPEISVHVPGGSFVSHPDWYYNYKLLVEQARGFDSAEDLFTPGTVDVHLSDGSTVAVVVSTEPNAPADGGKALAAEAARRTELLNRAKPHDDLSRALILAADQFLARRGAEGLTVIAGYPWFTDWGRDTMIALPGLTLATGRWQEGRNILETFLNSVSEGMIPNLFPDGNQPPLYNTVDATLWLFVALFEYIKTTQDRTLIDSTTLTKLKEILDWHYRGTRFGIGADIDGLLSAGDNSVQLTWMDAKIGDWVVTPRSGKAVEIQALWYNAHCILAELLEQARDSRGASQQRSQAQKIKDAFDQAFWCAEHGYYFDYIDGDNKDAALRPNQIFALSLPFPIAIPERATAVLKKIRQELYTPVGLRTLTPKHPAYQGRYVGGPRQRDGAYHQGTVWAWLLGPYISALLRFGGAEGPTDAAAAIKAIAPHLLQGCIGSVSEIFDGDAPHIPRGAFAQAWSVGEILRAHLQVKALPEC